MNMQINKLTPRENEICKTMLQQKIFRKKELAKYFGVSNHTIHDHFVKIYEKLNVHTTAELVDWLYTNKGQN